MFGKLNWFYVSCILGIVLVMFIGNQVVLYSKEEAMITDLKAQLELTNTDLKKTKDELDRIKFEKDVLVSQKDVQIKNLTEEVEKIKDKKIELKSELQTLKSQTLENKETQDNDERLVHKESKAKN